LSIVVIALTGGWLATHSALLPIRRLTAAVRRIIRTGQTDTRVPLAGTNDAIDELTSLFNTMLDRIEGLVTAMRGALDNVSHDLDRDAPEAKGVTLVASPVPPPLTSVPHGAGAGGGLVVQADRTRLEQVAANLIDNAIKYTPSGGRVEVETRRDGAANAQLI